MDKYTDLKFEGDLAFLNEHIEQARNISDVVVNDTDKEVNAAEIVNIVPKKNYFENNGNFAYNLTSQASVSTQSKWNIKNQFVNTKNDLKDVYAADSLSEDSVKIKDYSRAESEESFQNADGYNTIDDVHHDIQFDNSEKNDELDSQNASDFHDTTNFQEVILDEFYYSESTGDISGIEITKNLVNDDSFKSAEVQISDELNIINDEQYAKELEHIAESNSLDVQNTGDKYDVAIFNEAVGLNELIDVNPINHQLAIEQPENLDNYIDFQNIAIDQKNDEYTIYDEERNNAELEQSVDSISPNSQIIDDSQSSVIFNEIGLNEINDSVGINNDAIFEQLENLQSNNSFQIKSSFQSDDEYNNTGLDQSTQVDLLNIQNIDDSQSSVVVHEIGLNEFNGSVDIDHVADFEKQEILKDDNSFQSEASVVNTDEISNIDEEYNNTELAQATKDDLLNAQNVIDIDNKKNFLEIILGEFNDSESIDNDVDLIQPENVENDSNVENITTVQNIDEHKNNDDLQTNSKFDQSDIMENTRNFNNNESFQNAPNFQDASLSKFGSAENNQNDLTEPETLEKNNTFQSNTNYKSSPEFNSNNEPVSRSQFEQSDNARNITESQMNDNFQSSSNFHDPNPSFTSPQSNQIKDDFAKSERLRNDDNLHSTRNFQNNDDFSKINDLRYGTQFEQSENTANLRSAQHSDSFHNANSFQDSRLSGFTNAGINQNRDYLGQTESVRNESDFQSPQNFTNTEVVNNRHDLQYRDQFEQSEKYSIPRNSNISESFQNPSAFQDVNVGKFYGSVVGQNMADIPLEGLKKNTNPQETRNFKNVNDFNNRNDLNHRTQFEQSDESRNWNAPDNENFQTSKNVQDPRFNRQNVSENNQNQGSFSQAEMGRNDSNFQGVRNHKNVDEYNNINDARYRAQYDQSEKIGNLRSSQNNENVQNRGNVHHVNNANDSVRFYNRNSRQYIQNPRDLENAANWRQMQNLNINQYSENTNFAGGVYRNNQRETNQSASDHLNSKNIIDINAYPVNEFEIVQPSISRRKGQLELMLLRSGFDMELFNNFKEELLELEKDNIIMKYKQDLMMTLLKS